MNNWPSKIAAALMCAGAMLYVVAWFGGGSGREALLGCLAAFYAVLWAKGFKP